MPDFIKIDVEGAEADVLGGMTEILSTHRPLLAIEVHTVQAMFQVQQQLANQGYSPQIISTPEDVPSRCFLWAQPLVASPRSTQD